MVIEIDRSIRRKESVKVVIRERVWVSTDCLKDHEVRHVHDTDTELRAMLSQEGSGSDDFKCDFDANADKNAEYAESVA